MGRPPKNPAKVRRNRIVTFVTDAQLAALQNISHREGKPLSAIVHRLVLEALEETHHHEASH